MVNIEAGVAEAATESVVVRVMTLVRYAFVQPMHPRLGGGAVVRLLRQGATSMNAVSPDYALIGGKTVA